jgi:hypothetical protein
MHEDPAPTPEEQEQAPERLPEQQETGGPGQGDEELPADNPPSEPIHES